MTADDHTVHRDTSAAANSHDISHPDLFYRDLGLYTFSYDKSHLGTQVHQLTNRIAGLTLGASLQKLAHSHKGQDHGGGFKI